MIRAQQKACGSVQILCRDRSGFKRPVLLSLHRFMHVRSKLKIHQHAKYLLGNKTTSLFNSGSPFL
ncbi:hypothetical protein Mapa_009742 [Marchantia paleacea]|nr:hypothetical protein Mapa_009742 [Marchantia paleacea]